MKKLGLVEHLVVRMDRLLVKLTAQLVGELKDGRLVLMMEKLMAIMMELMLVILRERLTVVTMGR
jgi:hypothetical protein